MVCYFPAVSPGDPNFALVMEEVLAMLGQQLRCDRVFLYLRSPETHLGRVPFCWRKQRSVPLIYDPDWKPEAPSLATEDPMFAAALQAQPSIFVEDVERASPEVLNREFERETFGHRALVHAHLCSAQTLWGVLQACVFGVPRVWSQGDRQVIDQAVAWLTPLALAYVQAHQPPLNGAIL
ncbi:GAF domain-containing protein [Nodosilinea sp. E11]|uniref:GAF domain-containing protein n=1 Tax=Nodosilinea sp. E11 TaxID=3037479 RepID=UPI00293439C0|nr:GAF domain-containing protein [Nodosilinea sp. E11]WOD37555.1 GAF domain-containing protein [Nodosilinea sp. E11]